MGVPKFFRWLSERYPKINQRVGRIPQEEIILEHYEKLPDSQPAPPDPLSTCGLAPEVDNLYIDMNGIIHGCAHNNNSDGDDDSEVVNAISEPEIFQNICYYLDRIVREVAQPNHVVYMAIDGVAPRAKLNQQRSRRYRSGKEGLIETTIYDAHQKKLAEESGYYTSEEESSSSSSSSDEDQSSDDDEEGEEVTFERGLHLEEVPEASQVQEVEPGRFAGKLTATLDSNDEQDDQELFHSNNITPGTPFFTRCTNAILHFIKRKISQDPAWQKLTIVFSGPHVPGEGEHKIMGFMREQRQKADYNPNLRHCIVGQDGDLIMLGLATHEPNLTLLREQVLFDARRRQSASDAASAIDGYLYNRNFEFLHMNVLRDYLAYEFETSNVIPGSPWNLENSIDDFIFLTFFVGNDFLPHMPAIDIADEAFDLIMYKYREQRKLWKRDKIPYLTHKGSIVSGQRLEDFLQVLGRHETMYFQFKKSTDDLEHERRLEARYGMNNIPSDEVIALKEASDRAVFRERITQKINGDEQHYQGFTPVLSARPQRKKKNDDVAEKDPEALVEHMGGLLRIAVDGGKDVHVDDQDIKGRYYSDKFGFSPFDADQHLKLRQAYIEGLVWNLKYYFEGCVSWEWFYPYHYGPMLSDLVGIEKMLENVSFDGKLGKPLQPFEQLMACMPPSHADVLPEPYRVLMTEPDSPIADFYPLSFTIDMNGKRWPWEAVVLLPFINSKRLIEASQAVDQTLVTDEERMRNEFGGAIVLEHDPSTITFIEAAGESKVFASLENCHVKITNFDESPLNYKESKRPVFEPKVFSDTQVPLPGFPSLRDGSVRGLWRKLLRINVHGSKSRYKTACLEIENPIPEVLPTETLAVHLNGTLMWINYPHYVQALVTAVSDSKGIIRGKAKRMAWSGEEAASRKKRVTKIVDNYVFGEKLVGTGGVALLGGEDAMDDCDTLLFVRPFKGLKVLPDGTVGKLFAKFELEVPLFATGWAPKKIDTRLANLPVLLEKDPFNAAEFVVTNQGHLSQRRDHKHSRGARAIRKPVNAAIASRAYHSFSTPSIASLALFPELNSLRAPMIRRSDASIRPSANSGALPLDFTGRRCLSNLPVQRSLATRTMEPRLGSLRGPARLPLTVGIAAFFVLFSTAAAVDFRATGFSANKPHVVYREGFSSADSSEGLAFLSKRKTPDLEFAHGTTTLSFVFQGGIVAAVDSRASMGSFVGSKTTQKVMPINSHMLGTMAGGAADCTYWIRKLRCDAALHELTEGRRMSVASASRILANNLYESRLLDLSVYTMIMGFDDDENGNVESKPRIYYVDAKGMRIEGEVFAVGSGSTLALGILDRERRFDMNVDEAVALGIKAIRYSTFRDAYSGGFINVYLITRDGWKRVFTEDLDQLTASKSRLEQD